MQVITSLPLVTSQFSIVDRLKKSLNSILPKFLEPAPSGVCIDFEDKIVRIVDTDPLLIADAMAAKAVDTNAAEMPSAPSPPKYTLKQYELGSFLSPARVSASMEVCPYRILKTDKKVYIIVHMCGKLENANFQQDPEGEYYRIEVTADRRCPIVDEEIKEEQGNGLQWGKLGVTVMLPAT